MAARGFAVVNISYRLLPQTDLRGQIQDIFAAFHWLEQHAAKHYCDLNRVFVCGDSAGGHLTGLAACIQLSEELQAMYRVKRAGFEVKAIGMSHGVCELKGFTAMSRKWSVDRFVYNEMSRMMFGKKPESAAWYGKSSFTEAAEGLDLPPVILISSEADALHKGQSVRLEAYLKEKKLKHKSIFWTKEQGEHLGHVFHIAYPDHPESIESNEAMLAFFLEHG